MANDDDDERVCKVYSSEDHFTAFVQFLLACMALASLYWKRLHEVPRRKFSTWFLDISKQAGGACYAHILNMIIAAVIADNVRGDIVLTDECAWYAINYVIDTTLGLVLAIFFLNLLDKVANERDWVSLKHSGVYHGKDGLWHWFHQLFAWIFILTLIKVIICVFMWLVSEPLAYIGGVLFAPLQANIRFELLFVMIFFPGILNILYFWITDSYLKAKKHHSAAHEDHAAVEKSDMLESETPYQQMEVSENGRLADQSRGGDSSPGGIAGASERMGISENSPSSEVPSTTLV